MISAESYRNSASPRPSTRPGESNRMARPADPRELIFKFGLEFFEAGNPPNEHAVRRIEKVLHEHAGEKQIGAAVEPPGGASQSTPWKALRDRYHPTIHHDDLVWFVDLAPHLGPAPRSSRGPWTGIKISARLCMGNRNLDNFERCFGLAVSCLRGRNVVFGSGIPVLRTQVPKNATTSLWVGLSIGNEMWEPTVFRRLYMFMYLVEPIVCSILVPSWRSLQNNPQHISLRGYVSTLAIPHGPIDGTLDTFLGTAAAGRDLQVISWMWTCDLGRLLALMHPTAEQRLVLRSSLSLSEDGAMSKEKNMVEFRYLPGTMDMALLRGYAETCLAIVYFAKTSDDFQYASLLDDICECLEEPGGMPQARRLLLAGLGFEPEVAAWWEAVLRRLNNLYPGSGPRQRPC